LILLGLLLLEALVRLGVPAPLGDLVALPLQRLLQDLLALLGLRVPVALEAHQKALAGQEDQEGQCCHVSLAHEGLVKPWLNIVRCRALRVGVVSTENSALNKTRIGLCKCI
jgi:hypothetical protein